MSETCKTVKIDAPDVPGGFIVINAADFDPVKHKIFGSKEQDKTPRKGKKA